jgi:hypothetical protein
MIQVSSLGISIFILQVLASFDAFLQHLVQLLSNETLNGFFIIDILVTYFIAEKSSRVVFQRVWHFYEVNLPNPLFFAITHSRDAQIIAYIIFL